MSSEIDTAHTSDVFLNERSADLVEFLGREVTPSRLTRVRRQPSTTGQLDRAVPEELGQQLVAEEQPERQAWRAAVCDWLQRQQRTTVLDYRGGLGYQSLLLARRGFIPIYYDVPDLVCSFARYQFARHGMTVESVNHLDPLPRCDAVIASGLFTRCADPLVALLPLFKQLSCGIPLLLAPPPGDPLSKRSLTAVERGCKEAGFSLLDQLGAEGHGRIFVRPYRVDIIVPVDDASEQVVRCLESVKRHTSPSPQLAVRVVLVTEVSSEQQVLTMLAHVKAPEWLVLSNETNPGFVRTANRGIALDPTADVVLLDSETQVTHGWLTGLLEAAYQANDIATVTALSNAASRYCWPPEGTSQAMTPEVLARLVTACSPKLRPTIPTAGRCCVYLKRAALNKIGFLAAVWEPGSQAADEFCTRAVATGYRHILADDVFVWHQERRSRPASGDAQVREVAQENEPLLLKQALADRSAVCQFPASDRVAQSRDRLTSGAVRELARNRRRIMYVLHKPFNRGFIGGTELHVEELVRNLRYDYICYVLYPDGENHILEEFADTFVRRYVLPHSRTEELLEGVLRGFGMDIVHIQHLMGMPPSLLRVARALKIPVLLSIHDHFSICPNLWLVDPHGQYCGLPSDPLRHQRCLETFFEKPPLSVPHWRAHYAQLLREVDVTLFFSEDTKQRFGHLFLLSQARVFPYGIRLPEKVMDRSRKREEEQFSVCFLGYANTTKGKDLIQIVAPQLVRAGIPIHFLGSLKEDWPTSWPALFGKQMFFHGRYLPDEVVPRLREIGPQLVCLLSLLPETFSRTLSEAWAAGVPVLVGPVGAQAERVRQTGGGLVLAALKAQAIMEAIVELQHNRRAYEGLRAAVKKIPICSERDMVGEYRTLYRTILTDCTLQTPQEEFITALASSQAQTPSESSRAGKPLLETVQEGPMTLEHSERIRDLMPRTVVGQVLGVASMVYLRAYRLGWKAALGRPLRKLHRRWRQRP